MPIIENLKLFDLIDTNGKLLNSHLIHNLVGKAEAEKVLKTPLFAVVQVDKIVCKFEKNGMYTIRGAYRNCVEKAIETNHLRVREN